MWEIPYIYKFCMIFRQVLNIPEFELDELEESFLQESLAEPQSEPGAGGAYSPYGKGTSSSSPSLLKFLNIHFLKTGIKAYQKPDWSIYKVLENTIERYFDSFSLASYFKRSENPLSDYSQYLQVPPKFKVKVLKTLCDILLQENEAVKAFINDNVTNRDDDDNEMFRWDPIGRDSKGNHFFYIDATTFQHGSYRLYREEKNPDRPSLQSRKNSKRPRWESIRQPSWELVCGSREDMEALGITMRSSRYRSEKDVGNWIMDEALPKLIEAEKRREIKARTNERKLRNLSISAKNILSYDGRGQRSSRKTINYNFDEDDTAFDEILQNL